MKIKQLLKIVMRRETPMARGQRAMVYVKKRSAYLGKRPFSDSSDEDLRNGFLGSGW